MIVEPAIAAWTKVTPMMAVAERSQLADQQGVLAVSVLSAVKAQGLDQLFRRSHSGVVFARPQCASEDLQYPAAIWHIAPLPGVTPRSSPS